MPAARTIVHEPADKAMTLAELQAFVQDALQSGALGAEVPKVKIAFNGTIKRIETTLSAPTPVDRVDRP